MESVTLSRAKKSLDMAKKVADNNRQLEDGKEYPINLSIIGAEKDSVECIQGTVTFKDGVGRVSPNLFEHLGMGATLSYKNNNITLIGKDAETFAVSSNYNGINIVGREKAEKENMKDIDGNHLKKEDLNLKNVKDPKNARFQLDNKALKQKRQEMQDLRAESNEIMNQQFQDQLRNMPRLMRLLQMLEDYNYKIANSQANAAAANSGLKSNSIYDLYNLDKLHEQFHTMSYNLKSEMDSLCAECRKEIEKPETMVGKSITLGEIKGEESATTMSLLDASNTIRGYMAPIIAENPNVPIEQLLRPLGIPVAIYNYAEVHQAKMTTKSTSLLDRAINRKTPAMATNSTGGLSKPGFTMSRRTLKARRLYGSKGYRTTSPEDTEKIKTFTNPTNKQTLTTESTNNSAKSNEPLKGETKAESAKGETKAESSKVESPKGETKAETLVFADNQKTKPHKYRLVSVDKLSRNKEATPETPAVDQKPLGEKPHPNNPETTKTTQDNPISSNGEQNQTTVVFGDNLFKNLRIISMISNPEFVGPMPLEYLKIKEKYDAATTEVASITSSQTATEKAFDEHSIPLNVKREQTDKYKPLTEKNDAGTYIDSLENLFKTSTPETPRESSATEVPRDISTEATRDSSTIESRSDETKSEEISGAEHSSGKPLDHTATDWESVFETMVMFDEEEHHEHEHNHSHKINPEITQLEAEISKLTLAQAQELEDLDASFDERTMRFVLKHLKFSREEMKKELYDYSNILQADKSLTPAKRKQKLLLEQDKIKKRQEKEFTDKLLKQKFLQRKIYANLLLKHSLAKAKYLLKLEQLADKCKSEAKHQKQSPMLDHHFAEAVDHVVMDMVALQSQVDAYAAELRAQGKFEEAANLEAKANKEMEGMLNNNPESQATVRAIINKKFIDGRFKRFHNQLDPSFILTSKKIDKSDNEHHFSHPKTNEQNAFDTAVKGLVNKGQAHYTETEQSLAKKVVEHYGLDIPPVPLSPTGRISRDQFLLETQPSILSNSYNNIPKAQLAKFRKGYPTSNQTGPTGPQGPQ